MKYIKSVLILIVISFAFGITEEEKKRLDDLCTEELESYRICNTYPSTTEPTTSMIRQFCEEAKNSGCYEFYNDPNKYVPHCEEAIKYFNDQVFFFLYKYYDYYAAAFRSYCETKEDGTPCEFHKLGSEYDLSTYRKITEENCKSKRCTETYIEKLKKFIEYGLTSEEEQLEYITSDDCKSRVLENNTTSSRCGPGIGKCAKSSDCCSQYGYCGNTTDYCGKGCQSEFGICENSEGKVSISTVSGRCGPDYGACAKAGECCSRHNYCGTSSSHCGNGCQSEFGVCTKSSSNKISVSTVSGRCGPDYGACAKAGECCSQYNYCGTSATHCGTGCQNEFGVCTTNPSTVSKRCGPDYGKCAKSGECCSQYGYCGTTSAHCDTGCQPKYGLCN